MILLKELSCLNLERNLHRSSSVYKQSKTVLNKCQWILIWEDNRGSFIMNSGLTDWLEAMVYSLKRLNYVFFFLQTCRFSLHKTLTDGLKCGLLWCFCQLFGLSFWRHPFRIHWWICSDEETHPSTLLMAWAEGEYFFSKFPFIHELFL